MSAHNEGGPRKGRPDNTTSKSESYREDATAVGQLVAAILDGHVPDLPAELAEVAKIRAGTRRVLEAGLASEDEARMLRALASEASRHSLALWALEAMEAEILEPEPPALLPRDAVARARSLRLWGHSKCPTCRRELLSEYELNRDDRVRTWAEEDAEVRRRAVPGEVA